MKLPSQHSNRFPDPQPDALRHSAELSEHLREIIRQEGGHVGFDRFMREALYAPGLGYYAAGASKLGAAGDFTTAPEVSPVFGRCVARQCAEILRQTGGSILEVGAGTGRLAADVLDELGRQDSLPETYRILEVSADLRARQAETLASCGAAAAISLQWLDHLPDSPFKGVILANEVLDALPVRCFEIQSGAGRRRVAERVVMMGDEGFRWDSAPADDALLAAVEEIEGSLAEPLPIGYQSEVCVELGAWLASLLERVSAGAAIFSDYGLPRRQYYLRERGRGTLVSHYRHRMHDDPFAFIGLQDLSAWVDFTALAEAGTAAGWAVAGFTTQAHFLIGAGLEEVMMELSGSSMRDTLSLASEVKTLTLPGEMGERFKFMALTKNLDIPLRGFEFVDMRGAL